MKKLVTAAAAAAVLGLGAQAGAADWSGFYLGAQVGYEWGDTDHTYSLGAPSGTSDLGGMVLGAHVGWLNQTPGGFVWGLEIDGEWSSVDGSYDNTTASTSAGAADIDWQGSARGRIGFATGDWLISATGGGAVARIDAVGGPSPSCACGAISPIPSSTEWGWTVGGGIEYMFSGDWSFGVEYRYTDLGSFSGTLVAFPLVTMGVDTTTHAVRARLGYHW